MIKFYFDSPGYTLLPTGWTKCDFIMLPLWLYPCRSDCFFFFWYLFVFQNNFQYHLDKTFHSELISCHYSVSTAQPLLKTGRSSGDLNVIATEGTYHHYRVDESYPAFVTSTVSRVLDILEICLTVQILHHWHCSMASKIYLI